MATTTNFGWETPDDTDLVKDGAAAIRTLGGAIDTSLVDLKGGTTGQILSKASNTDMDFTWTSANPGDITEVTAGTGLTGGGTSGAVSLAFDVANYGGGQWAAGKNKIINGDFRVWQRGTTFTSPASGAYTADRFFITKDGTGNCTISQQSFTAGTAPVSGYESQFFYRISCTSVGSTTTFQTQQRIEDVRTFAGQTITISFWAKKDNNKTIGVFTEQNFGSGGSSPVFITTGRITPSTSWARYSVTLTLASIAGKTIGAGSYLSIYFAMDDTLTTSSVLDIWGVQVEAGSVATPFQTATGTLQGELAACQRYYYRLGGNQVYETFGNGMGFSSTLACINFKHPVSMRVAPSSIDYSTIANWDGTGIVAITSAAIGTNQSAKDYTVVNMTSASSLVQYRPYSAMTNNSLSGYIGFSAEL